MEPVGRALPKVRRHMGLAGSVMPSLTTVGSNMG